ncbi:hypothetical protein LY78DRAFT_97109 [Colletotrichum sublineola]|nr:hypothetical protein LY78DRAFT_97109 [Colletotrichum sublineola]
MRENETKSDETAINVLSITLQLLTIGNQSLKARYLSRWVRRIPLLSKRAHLSWLDPQGCFVYPFPPFLSVICGDAPFLEGLKVPFPLPHPLSKTHQRRPLTGASLFRLVRYARVLFSHHHFPQRLRSTTTQARPSMQLFCCYRVWLCLPCFPLHVRTAHGGGFVWIFTSGLATT